MSEVPVIVKSSCEETVPEFVSEEERFSVSEVSE